LKSTNFGTKCHRMDFAGQLLWVVNIADENATDLERELSHSSATSSIPLCERQRLSRYHSLNDRYLGVVSFLLKRAVIREYLAVDSDDGIDILITSEVYNTIVFLSLRRSYACSYQKKPYATYHCESLGTWNFNVSHHGPYVCAASIKDRLVRYVAGTALLCSS
jgi:hypothetical protein